MRTKNLEEKAAARQLVIRMYDAGDSIDEIEAASELGRSYIAQLINASGRDVAFRPYGRPDSPPAMEFAKKWEEVTAMVRRKLGISRRK